MILLAISKKLYHCFLFFFLLCTFLIVKHKICEASNSQKEKKVLFSEIKSIWLFIWKMTEALNLNWVSNLSLSLSLL